MADAGSAGALAAVEELATSPATKRTSSISAVAAAASAVAASIGCSVFAAGSSNGSSSWRATPSRVGPLCWQGVLGFATDVSSLKESSIWESVCVWWGKP